MKEKKSLVKASMKLPDKKVLNSSKPLSDINGSIEKIHSKDMVRLSLDVPPELYKDLKSHHFKKGYRTTRAYLLALIERDLNL
jgi:hypothetical protein